MILLEKLDLPSRSATFRTLGSSRGRALAVIDRLRGGLTQLGIDRLAVTFESGRTLEMSCALSVHAAPADDSARAPSATGEEHASACGAVAGTRKVTGAGVQTRTADPGPHPASTAERSRIVSHHLGLEDGKPTYVARFPHRLESLETIALYCGVALSTFGPLTGPLHFVRLAVYELCANAVEHGRPVAKETEVEVGLAYEAGVVTGWIRDRCEAFDPFASPLPALAEHAAEGARRGYGLHMVRRILTNLTHDFDGSGNRLSFRKEIA